MFIPQKNVMAELIVEKSRFLALVFPFDDVKKTKPILDEVKEKYPKARHYLFAYQIEQISKSNDDQEPGKIAQGFINLIKQHQLDHILVVVVRYFGGVKLGASRLNRTYQQVVNEALKKVTPVELALLYQYVVKVDYPTYHKLVKLGYHIENPRYFDKIEIDIISKLDILPNLKQFTLELIKVNRVMRKI